MTALDRFLEAFDAPTLVDIGPHLTCSETEAFIALLLEYGQTGSAAALLEAHALHDDVGDEHFQPS